EIGIETVHPQLTVDLEAALEHEDGFLEPAPDEKRVRGARACRRHAGAVLDGFGEPNGRVADLVGPLQLPQLGQTKRERDTGRHEGIQRALQPGGCEWAHELPHDPVEDLNSATIVPHAAVNLAQVQTDE